MPITVRHLLPGLAFACFLSLSLMYVEAAENPFLGRWGLTLPNGRAGWLGVVQTNGALKGSLLWGGGSVLPVDETKIEGDTLVIKRYSTSKPKGKAGKKGEEKSTETIIAQVDGDQMNLTTETVKANGQRSEKARFTGQRIPPLPPRPTLAKVKFGEPVSLFNGKDLAGWRLVDAQAESGWKVQDGVLMNRVVKEPGRHFGNLRTEGDYEDFNLRLEVRTQENSNSGVYLRGIYEVQIAESYGKPVDSHNMGALYSRITPTVAAEKPIGEWQTVDITLVQRHLTVVLNGKTIIDNQPILGCTGGALWSDESRPGPLILQGDHTNIDYRNLVIRPVIAPGAE
jgi:hypothetical protein